MIRIQFIFLGEGTSDSGLIPHLENLCVQLGADEVTGAAVDFRRLSGNIAGTVEAKLKAALKLEPNTNLIFVHRDSDSRDSMPRYEEIASAVAASAMPKAYVCVVPVQEMEAWILLDEASIRNVAGRRSGKVPLNLPRPNQVESIASPEERLMKALLDAAELTGRRRARFQAEFPTHRQLLLERLPTGGALLQVPSWTRLNADLAAAVKSIGLEEPSDSPLAADAAFSTE